MDTNICILQKSIWIQTQDNHQLQKHIANSYNEIAIQTPASKPQHAILQIVNDKLSRKLHFYAYITIINAALNKNIDLGTKSLIQVILMNLDVFLKIYESTIKSNK